MVIPEVEGSLPYNMGLLMEPLYFFNSCFSALLFHIVLNTIYWTVANINFSSCFISKGAISLVVRNHSILALGVEPKLHLATS